MMETESHSHQRELHDAQPTSQKLHLGSWAASISTVNSDRDSHEYCAIDLSSNSTPEKAVSTSIHDSNAVLYNRHDNFSPISSKDHEYDNESLDEDERAHLLRQYDESCRMGSGDITLFETGTPTLCEQTKTEDLDEINLEDGNRDIPAALANFEDEAHEIEYSISSGLASFSYISPASLAAATDSTISSIDQNAIREGEEILHKSYDRLSFLLKQNKRLAMKRETGPRTLTLRISRCDSIARQYFALNRKVLYKLESERDLLLAGVRSWVSALDTEVAEQLQNVDLRSGLSSVLDDGLLKTVWDKRIAPFNERMSKLSTKIMLLDQRCNMLIKLIEEQALLYRFTCLDNEFVEEVSDHIRLAALRMEQRERNSHLTPLKIVGVIFVIGLSLNAWYLVGL